MRNISFSLGCSAEMIDYYYYMSGAFRLFGLCEAVDIMTFELTIMLLQ